MRLGLLLFLLAGCASGSRQLVIFHTSDVHGGIESRPAKWHAANPARLIGGQAALGALVAAETRPKLLLDSGDIFQGTPIGNLTRGEAVVAGMNALGYTAAAVGNHEFDYGEQTLVALDDLADFPFLAANIRRKDNGERPTYAQPSLLVEVGGISVGIVGLATRHTTTSTLPANVAHLLFEDEVAAGERAARKLREQGAELVVALSHCGLAPSHARKRVDADALKLTPLDEAWGGDLRIARETSVDLVLGGHLHTGISGTWRDPVSGKVIVQSFEGLEAASRVEVTLGSDGEVTAKSELIDLWVDEHGEDARVLGVVTAYAERLGPALARPVATLSEDLRRAPPPPTQTYATLDSPLGNFFADAMWRSVPDADGAVQNTHGIRADLYAGSVTVRDVYRVMPFDNTVTVVTLSGAQLTDWLRGALAGGQSKLQVSNIAATVTFDERGAVSSLRIAVGGAAVEPERQYRIVTNSYLTSGGSGGLVGLPVLDTARSLRDVLEAELEDASPVSAPKTGRILQNL